MRYTRPRDISRSNRSPLDRRSQELQSSTLRTAIGFHRDPLSIAHLGSTPEARFGRAAYPLRLELPAGHALQQESTLHLSAGTIRTSRCAHC